MRPRILLLSGTSEGPVLARALLDAGLDVTATVTRDEARESLFGGLLAALTVEARGFDPDGLRAYLRQGRAEAVLDATHPFAARITRIAHDACAEAGVPYVRYERPDWEPPEGTRFASTFTEAADVVPTLGSRIMLTVGCKMLRHFAGLHGRVELFARVLPSPISMEQARAAGFAADRVFGLRPPFSREANRDLFRECRADVLVTKASGVEGGVVEKVMAAVDLGMTVLMVRRPALAVSPTLHDLRQAVAACREQAQRRPPQPSG
ncbi:MAG: precorrin-6A reductase [Isosphaeraceae bacterium]